MKREYKTLLNQIIDYSQSSAEVLTFLESVLEAFHNKAVSEKNLVNLVWSPLNPLLKTDLIPGKVFATKETYEDPAFRIIDDLIDRKRLEAEHLDLEAVKAKFSMSVKEAAHQLAVDVTTVRRAFHDEKMAGILVKGKIMLDPHSVAAFQVSNVGMRARNRLQSVA